MIKQKQTKEAIKVNVQVQNKEFYQKCIFKVK